MGKFLEFLVEHIDLIHVIIVAVAPFVAKYGYKILRHFADQTETKADNYILDKAYGVAKLVSKEFYQTMVKGLKEAAADGKLTAEEKKQLQQMAIHKIKSYMSWEEIVRLAKGSGTAEEALLTVLEGALHDVKADSKKNP